MIIKKITIKRFRAFREEKTLDFAPGLNIIKGSNNEAGKSSLRVAITKALFQDPASKKKEVETLTSWGVDEPWEVTLEFSSNSDSYILYKSFKDKNSELICTGHNEFVARNKDTIAKKIAELTGCPTEAFFESTACIGQEELIKFIPGNITDSDKQNTLDVISKRFRSKLSGIEDTDLPGLLIRLYDKTHQRDAGGPYAHIQAIIERIGLLRSQKHDLESRNTDILHKMKKLAQTREELDKFDPDLIAKQELWQKNKRIIELQREIDRDKDLYNNYQRAKEIKSKIDRLDHELISLSVFNGTEAQINEIEVIKRKLDELNQKRLELLEELKLLETHKPAIVVLVSGIVLVVGGLIAMLVNQLTWIGAVVGFLCCLYWVTNWRMWRVQISSVHKKLGEVKKSIHSFEVDIQERLKKLGQENHDKFIDNLAEYKNKTATKRDLTNQLEALTVGREWQIFAEEYSKLDTQMSKGIQEMEQLIPVKMESLSFQKLEDEIKLLIAQKSELEQEKGALEKFLIYTEAEIDQSAEIDELLSASEEERKFWEQKRNVDDLTGQMIDLASKQTLSKVANLLEEEISKYISRITDGRYNQVALSEMDLSIRTFSQLKNDWVDVRELSRATQDQFYICGRLALTRLITEGKYPPILLDDPFINFHSKRLRRMMTLLQEISRDFQIFLFTCSDSYDFLGKVSSVD